MCGCIAPLLGKGDDDVCRLTTPHALHKGHVRLLPRPAARNKEQ
jgi:hypothetical protein